MENVVYGKLTLVRRTRDKSRDGHLLSLWLCECGQIATIAHSRVINGYTRSCGCAVNANPPIKHGMRHSPEYRCWSAMKGRCLSPNHKDYPRWGGRGITVCEAWANSFEAFYADMGPRPAGTSLDRIDNAKGYEPGNVRWGTTTQQSRNRAGVILLNTPDGVFHVSDYAAKLGITRGALHQRLKRNQVPGVSHV